MLTSLTRAIPSSWTGARKQCGANRRCRPGRAASLPVAAVAETAVETAVDEPARAAWPAQQPSFRARGCAVEVRTLSAGWESERQRQPVSMSTTVFHCPLWISSTHFLQVSSGPNGRGLFAKRDVPTGREALSVPLYACLLVIDDPGQPEGEYALGMPAHITCYSKQHSPSLISVVFEQCRPQPSHV